MIAFFGVVSADSVGVSFSAAASFAVASICLIFSHTTASTAPKSITSSSRARLVPLVAAVAAVAAVVDISGGCRHGCNLYLFRSEQRCGGGHFYRFTQTSSLTVRLQGRVGGGKRPTPSNPPGTPFAFGPTAP